MARQIRIISKEAMDDEEGSATMLKLHVFSLYASQQSEVQLNVFSPTQLGFRKVVVATNVAETSITIPGIRYVVDSCRVKAK